MFRNRHPNSSSRGRRFTLSNITETEDVDVAPSSGRISGGGAVADDETTPTAAPRASNNLRKRKMSISDDTTTGTVTVASSSASKTSYLSSASGNIWSKMLSREELWDGLGDKDVYDDDDFDDDVSLMGVEGGDVVRECSANARRIMKTCGLAWCYEARHFALTIWNHPYIMLISLAAFGILCGVGIAAVNSERDTYIQKQKGTAEFVVSYFDACILSFQLLFVHMFYVSTLNGVNVYSHT